MDASEFYDVDGYCWLAKMPGKHDSGLVAATKPFDGTTWSMILVSFALASVTVGLIKGEGLSARLDIFGSIVNQTRALKTLAR